MINTKNYIPGQAHEELVALGAGLVLKLNTGVPTALK
jgi:hypothetical protein